MADANPPESPQITSPFAVPVFRSVWLASVASNFGGLIQSVGASWMMISLGATPQMIALVSASVTLPIMLLALVAGAMADNFDRRRVMLAAQGFMLVVSVALSVCAYAGILTPWLLLAFTFLIGCGTAFNGPAWQASVGEMVPRSVLPTAVAYNSVGYNIARSLGPAIGGAIVAAAGAVAAFATNALSYIGLIVVLLRWRPAPAPRSLPREALGVAMAAGVRYVLLSPNILGVLIRAGVFGLAASAMMALMPLIARDLVQGGPLTYGMLLGAFGIGAVAGALLSRRLRERFTTERLVSGASLAMAAGAAVCALSGWLALTMASLAISGAGWVLALSSFNVSVQFAAPRWVVARALALYQMFTFGGMAIGSWLYGWMTDHHGVASALLAASAGLAVSAALGLFLPVPKLESINLDPRGRWQEPQTAVPIEPRSGPIVVTIEYRIAPGDVRAFLEAMNERRRIRLRDGARGWSLMRDLGNSELWVERYHVSTWLDYVRHNTRRTHADSANSEAIAALHQGPQPPVIHRMIERQTGSLPGLRLPSARELADPMTDPTRAA
ncbi:MFS transporter [Sphingomonas turrisvirgatae]|uniref:ABC transporter permease n=1 Tax=Sphingomonas turrisvirgatae TaxID=1888892 RepID=A0A1E3LR56_9SPHN|nr:MFS transporter [Sphingomonas turrisvirgatae]ODP36228.1 ABC transporter permease [Sphingomonas turrisvirgatae]